MSFGKDIWRIPALMLLLVLVLPLIGCVRSTSPVQPELSLSIPKQSDWTDYGPIFEAGTLGEWDYQLAGGFTNTAIKKNGVYYLYYQGSRGYRTAFDETVTWRAIGVATSPDGINFSKAGNNPIITWSPNNGGEEGAVSGGVTLDDNGEIVLFYGANTAVSDTRVNADGRLAVSEDGLIFSDRGVVLDHQNGSVWGSGDELFPIIAIHDADQWIVYYLPNGSGVGRNLGVAWGNDSYNLTNSSRARIGFTSIHVWGTGGSAKVGPDTYALFLNVGESKLEVRLMSPSTPYQLTTPVETYWFEEFGQVRQATVLLDEETGTWFMYYKSEGEYGVKLAPAGELDTTPPTAPDSVIATPVSDRQINLSWNPATDSETGIVLYNVFRDGAHQATIKGWNFSDTGLVEQTEYNYQVSAVNYHGVQGLRSKPIIATTLVDVTPPRIVSVNAGSSSTQITVVFDEPVEQVSAETVTNYAINGGITITGASLDSDLKSVVLTTSEHSNGTYQITVNNVRDRAATPNPMAANTVISYTHTGIGGLVGAWTFDEGMGETAFDTANYGNDGALIYTNRPAPVWTAGKFGSALEFDGMDDQVTIDGAGSLQNITDGSHTFTAWVNPDSVPPNTTPNNVWYSLLVREYTGLYYDENGKFMARVQLSDDQNIAVSSDVFDPGAWHHLAMVVDDTNKKLHLYVDGQEVSDSPVSYDSALADHEDAPYYIGTSEPLTELYEYRFKGKIDEVRIFDRASSLSEVQKLSSLYP